MVRCEEGWGGSICALSSLCKYLVYVRVRQLACMASTQHVSAVILLKCFVYV